MKCQNCGYDIAPLAERCSQCDTPTTPLLSPSHGARMRVDGGMAPLLVIISILVAALGVLLLSEATAGVGVLCAACYLAIMARVAQASAHNAAIVRAHNAALDAVSGSEARV